LINIYTGNHTFPRKPYKGWGITDHISFLSEFLNSKKLDFKISNFLESDMHNIIIENFDYFDVLEVEALLRSRGTYSIVLTEHMKNSSGIIWDNRPLDLKNNYMHLADLRFFNLMRLIPNAKSLFTIFGVPASSEIKSIIPNSSILNLDLTWDLNQIELNKTKYDLCFFGKITAYRKILLNDLKEKFKDRLFVGEGIDKFEREKIILNSKYNLHIPISKSWEQQSPMRIYSAAKLGRKTLFINFDYLDIDHLHSHQLSKFIIEVNDIDSIIDHLKIKTKDKVSDLKNFKPLNFNNKLLKDSNEEIKRQSRFVELLNFHNNFNNSKNLLINIYDKKIFYYKNHFYISKQYKNQKKFLNKNDCINQNHLKEFKSYRNAISYIYKFTYLKIKGKTIKDDLRYLYYDLLLDFLFNKIIKLNLNNFSNRLFVFRPKNRLKKFYHEIRKIL